MSGTTTRNIHPLTPILVNVLPLSPFSICNGPRHPLYSAYVLDSPLGQPLSRSSLVFPFVLNPQLHTQCISSPNHHLFAAHAHTNAACSAAISMLCHLHLVSTKITHNKGTGGKLKRDAKILGVWRKEMGLVLSEAKSWVHCAQKHSSVVLAQLMVLNNSHTVLHV